MHSLVTLMQKELEAKGNEAAACNTTIITRYKTNACTPVMSRFY